MSTAESTIIVYEETDVIKCPECAKHLLFGDLMSKEGNSGYIAGKLWRSIYYHCVCNDQRVLVFDPGDGDFKRLIEGIIVKKQ